VLTQAGTDRIDFEIGALLFRISFKGYRTGSPALDRTPVDP
jgi:hypothetical protein